MKLVRGLVVLAVTWPAACGDTVTEPEIPNRTPVGVGTIPPQRLEPGESVTVDVSSYFDDPDGDPLTYQSASREMKIGDEQVHFETLTGAPPELQQLTAVGLWVVPYEQETGKTGLFDWIEVTGDTASGDRTDASASEIRPVPAAAATPPPQAARPQRRSGRWPPPGSRD